MANKWEAWWEDSKLPKIEHLWEVNKKMVQLHLLQINKQYFIPLLRSLSMSAHTYKMVDSRVKLSNYEKHVEILKQYHHHMPINFSKAEPNLLQV